MLSNIKIIGIGLFVSAVEVIFMNSADFDKCKWFLTGFLFAACAAVLQSEKE